MTGNRLVQRCAKRRLAANLGSNKTRDYSSKRLWKHRRRSNESANVYSPMKIPDLLRYGTASKFLLEVHHQQLGFGHFFDGVAQSFAAQSGILDPTIGHVVDAECRHVAGDQPAYLQFLVGVKD
jgi:hypothetical protein